MDNMTKEILEKKPPFAKSPIKNPDGEAKNKTTKTYNFPIHLCTDEYCFKRPELN